MIASETEIENSGALNQLLVSVKADPAFKDLEASTDATFSVADCARAFIIAGIAEHGDNAPVVVVVPTQTEADRMSHDLCAFLSADQIEQFPAWETLPFERVSPGVRTMGQRMRVFHRLTSKDNKLKVVVAPIRAMLQRLGPHVEDCQPLKLIKGSTADLESILRRLVELGYQREYQVEHPGEFSVRGSIVDVFPSTSQSPIRIDMWGDDVERLCEFSPGDQRSIRDLESVSIFPARELIPTEEVQARARELAVSAPWAASQWEKLSNSIMFDGMESLLPWIVGDSEHILGDVIPQGARVVLCEPRRLRDRANDILGEESSIAQSLATTWGVSDDTSLPKLHLEFDRLLAHTSAPVWNVVPVAESDQTTIFTASPAGQGSGSDPEVLAKRLSGLISDGNRVVIAAEGPASAARMQRSFADVGLHVDMAEHAAASTRRWLSDDLVAPVIIVQPLDRGFVSSTMGIALIAEADITGRRIIARTGRHHSRRKVSSSFFDDLHAGDYVVHHQHGVGKYHGMVKRTIGGVERDYLLLEYRGDDKLYIPSDQIDSIRPYSGSENPSLHKLGGSDWKSTKSRVRSAVAEIAQELVVLYQRRQVSKGHAFAPDTPWQHELEEAFIHNETPDQLTAVKEIKEDMERAIPMDRLICGDVGFGKTEVAIRAAFKAIQDGKQVAVLVPTTLLARQHMATFSERFSGYPIRVEAVSRFQSASQVKAISKDLLAKKIDIVIGTHRLLAQDIKFADLGLLIIDEEQRFGVDHKEAIKKMRTNVDVLTLSATPIPRTLEMSLTGLRDLTLLQTPPSERQPILTYVGEFDDRAVGEAIRRELLREGQVFYVHNRVASIEDCARHLRELVPEARVCVAHGQMDESLLEQIVVDFSDGEYDVLVCTTIIESGIDMPAVNTLVVERADLLGLGQLHQIRGRVGRAGQRAYAYLFYPPNKEMTEDAYERLRTIGKHTELGSGFKIAMRDLQIRGAGNLLGGSQSGHVAAVGYDLYVQMVSEAVGELKGEQIREPAEIKLEVPVDASLPNSYIARDDLRLDAYRRLATVESLGEVGDIEAEWKDRFGEIPPQACALLAVARLRAVCVATGIREISVVRGVAKISPVALLASKEIRLKRLFPRAIYKRDVAQLQIPLNVTPNVADDLVKFVQDMVVVEGE